MCMLFNVIIFSVDEVIEIFRSMGKNFRVCRCAFYLFESKRSEKYLLYTSYISKSWYVKVFCESFINIGC